MLLLVFGLTLPLYLGYPALVEALSQDNGVGTLLIVQMTKAFSQGTGFGSLIPALVFYQVTIFLFVYVVLAGRACSPTSSLGTLDPRLLRSFR